MTGGSTDFAPATQGSNPRVRSFITPEGVDLRLVLASAGQRVSAFLIDLAILLGVMIVLTIVCLVAAGVAGRAAGGVAGEVVIALWLLGFFALRNGYFLAFELSGRAATPGKRAIGLRVASRDGGRLTADAVFARNAMREVELFLPVAFMVGASVQQEPLMALSGLGWTMGVLLVPLFNRDRLRAGDLIAGTWVVNQPRRALRRDMAEEHTLAPRFAFSTEQLDAYGERELQVLEEILRRNHGTTVAEVAGRIRKKIGWTAAPDERDLDFLDAFYTAERRKLESDMLFGKRRLDKNDRRSPKP